MAAPADSRDLAERIGYAMDHYETMQEVAENAREYLVSHYSHSFVRDTYFEFHESLGV